MQNFEVKITGNGTKDEIIESLNSLIATLEEGKGSDITGTYEDQTLCTEISI